MNKAGIKQFMRKHWVAVWLVLSVISLTTFFVVSEYITNHNRVKRVIAVTSSKSQLFSSDRLMLLTGTNPEKKWYSVENKEAESQNGFYEVPIHIWDFDPANPKVLYEGDLNYTLTAVLVDGNGNPVTVSGMKYQTKENDETVEKTLMIKILDHGEADAVELQAGDWTGTETATKMKKYEKSHTLSEKITVSGQEISNKEHTVILYFDDALLEDASTNDVRVKLTASPNGHQELTTLSAIIGIKEVSQVPPTGWKGYLQETNSFDSYNGFNYTISGYGEEELTLYFRSDLLEINYWSYCDDITVEAPASIGTTDSTEHPGKFTSGTWSKLVITANSEIKSRYIFQLYLKENTGATYNDIADYYIYFPNNDTDADEGDG
ncbi:MAG: hypothetical protein IKN54_04655 [Lachnospiraceae bacterium]|nr:hypothetical protein [Lachnospiraceae bacterium]